MVRLGSRVCAQGPEPSTQVCAHTGTHAHTRRPAQKADPATRFREEGAGWRTRAPRATQPLPPSHAFPGPVLGLPRRHFLSWAGGPMPVLRACKWPASGTACSCEETVGA